MLNLQSQKLAINSNTIIAKPKSQKSILITYGRDTMLVSILVWNFNFEPLKQQIWLEIIELVDSSMKLPLSEV